MTYSTHSLTDSCVGLRDKLFKRKRIIFYIYEINDLNTLIDLFTSKLDYISKKEILCFIKIILWMN